MKYVDEVAQLFDEYVDEDDPTWFTSARVAVYLRLGYDRFRAIVSKIDPLLYAIIQDLTLADADEVNLATGAVKIMGSDEFTTGPRLSRLVKVEARDGAGEWSHDYRGAQNWEEIRRLHWRYLLEAQTLFLSEKRTGTIRLRYVPVSTVNWTKQTVGEKEHIDELEEFHDLIANYASDHYYVRDDSGPPQWLLSLRKERESELFSFLSHGRAPESNDSVAWVD